MKITDMITKKVVDDAISKSENIEGLCTVLVSMVVGALVASIFSKKSDSDGEGASR